jgi:hypothetical protein
VLNFARELLGRSRIPQVRGLFSPRPLVLLQSDDWGRLGVRDEEGAALLRESGIKLGEDPYDFYTLETAKDVIALRDLLLGHRDSTGRPPCMVMNFALANLDFTRMAKDDYREVHLLPLTEGLPGKWTRAGLFEAYRQGIADGVFYPALHGLSHFCRPAVEHELAKDGERRALLRTLWKTETPYIYWRMPWVGYEYCRPEKPRAGFLSDEAQTDLVRQATDIFTAIFDHAPVSACAPGYRANRGTHAAWSSCGVRVAQNGGGTQLPPHMDEFEMLNLYRTIDFEPSQQELPLENYMQLAGDAFARGIPVIVSTHSLNFHSSLKDFRGPSLRALDRFLSALEAKYSDLLYVHDADLYELVMRGKFTSAQGLVVVDIKQQDGGPKSRSVAWESK